MPTSLRVLHLARTAFLAAVLVVTGLVNAVNGTQAHVVLDQHGNVFVALQSATHGHAHDDDATATDLDVASPAHEGSHHHLDGDALAEPCLSYPGFVRVLARGIEPVSTDWSPWPPERPPCRRLVS